MSTLRDDIEQVVIDHFDPSIMGRAQAVDDILAAVKKHDEALAMRATAADGYGIVDQQHNAAIARRWRTW